MANYDNLTINILDIKERSELESIIKKVVNDNKFYKFLLSQKHEAYMEYTKKNKVIIYSKSRHILEIMENLEKYSKENPELNIEFRLSYEYEYWDTGYKYSMKGGESKLIKLSNYGMATHSQDCPESVLKLYEEGISKLKKLDKKDYTLGKIIRYPHPIEIELEKNGYNVKVKKEDSFYSLISFREAPELIEYEGGSLPF